MQVSVQQARSRFLSRPVLSSSLLTLLVVLYLMAVTNRTFWTKADLYLSATPGALVAFHVAVALAFIAFATLLSFRYLIRPAFILLVIVAGIGSWFTDRFGVVIDSDMVRNAFETTPAEAQHLITPDFIVHMLLVVGLPVAVLLSVRITHQPLGRKLARVLGVVLACVLAFGAIGIAFSKPYFTLLRQHRDLMESLNPVTPIAGTIKYAIAATRDNNIVVEPLGLDAKVTPPLGGIRKPRVTIIVAGETARAQDFSLGGYGRETNPELAARDVLYFPNTTSCGTATAVSIPCMFSRFTRSSYSHDKALRSETLVDVLAHAGVDVVWWDNNTGSKHVADRIPYLSVAGTKDPRFCQMGECQDGIFLDRLDQWLDHVTKDSVVVIHEIGSHGPTYYLRYPEAYRKFRPDCQTAELANCKDAEIVNAYDNTILYTDHILASFIDRLKARSDKIAGGMIYMSDHGESLGENGLYLHGTPYMFAPSVQTHVPFVVWFDDDFGKSFGVDRACLKASVGEPKSHDNLFHSVLGMMNISTSVYDPSLDVFAGCRSNKTS